MKFGVKCGWIAGLLALVLFLGGCVFPEKFDVQVAVNADASYSIHFEGEVASVSHVNLIRQQKQPLWEDQVTGLHDEARKMTVNTADVSAKAHYLGNGRFSLVSDEKYKAGTRTSFLAALMIDPTSDGVISIYAAPLADRQKMALKNIGLNMHGTLSVTLPKNTKLIFTNSTMVSRSYFDRKITYSWNIVDVSDEPELVFEVKANADKK